MLVYTITDSLGGLHNTCCETFEAVILGRFHLAELYKAWDVEDAYAYISAEVNPRVVPLVSTAEN